MDGALLACDRAPCAVKTAQSVTKQRLSDCISTAGRIEHTNNRREDLQPDNPEVGRKRGLRNPLIELNLGPPPLTSKEKFKLFVSGTLDPFPFAV
jgi:hypothetical protein